MSAIASKVAKNTGFLYIRLGITMFVSLYTTRIVLNALGTSDYGIFSLVGGAIAFLSFFSGALTQASQRFMSYAEGRRDKEKRKIIFNISLVLHFTLCLLLMFFLAIIGFFFFNDFFNIPEGREHVAVVIYGSLVLSTAFSVLSVPYEAVLNAHENMRYYAVVGILESLMKLGVALACVFTLMDKLIVYGVLMAFVPIVVLIIMWVYCHIHYEECVFAPRQYYDSRIAKEMTSFACWSFVSTASSVFTMQGIAIMLNYYGGVIVNTAHGIANQLSGQVMTFSNTMQKALNPALVKSCGAGKVQQMLRAAETGNKLAFGCFSVFAIPFIVETPLLLSLWLKEVPVWAVLFCRLVFIRQMLTQTYISFVTCINATGIIHYFSIISSVLWVSPIILGVILYQLNAPIYTIYILLIILALLRGVNTVYFCRKLCRLNIVYYIRSSLIPMTIVAAIGFGLLFFLKRLLVDYGLYGVISYIILSVIFFVYIFFVIVLNKAERQEIEKLIRHLSMRIPILRNL